MSADLLLSCELKSLQEEIATQRRRPLRSAGRPASSVGAGAGAVAIGAAPASRPEESAAEQQSRRQLHDLIKEITDSVEEAERNISARPSMSIVAAMLLGIAMGIRPGPQIELAFDVRKDDP